MLWRMGKTGNLGMCEREKYIGKKTQATICPKVLTLLPAQKTCVAQTLCTTRFSLALPVDVVSCPPLC